MALEIEAISPERRLAIAAQLTAIEQQQGIHVLYACESGSRAWGFSSVDSDYDVRFVYVHPARWYIPFPAPRDVIEVAISDDLDISGWDLRKALTLVKAGNATLSEWLGSPIVYRADPPFVAALRQALEKNFAKERAHYHYTHTARHKFAAADPGSGVHLKGFLYTLRALLAARWIDVYQTRPPTPFPHLVAGVVDDATLKSDIAAMVHDKRTLRETDHYQVPSRLLAFVETELTRLLKLRPRKARGLEPAALDALLCDTIARFDATG